MPDEMTTLTADMVLFSRHPDTGLHVLLIERGWDPFKGCLALPGGYVEAGEPTAKTARRELTEETGLDGPRYLTLVGAYAEPGRDPRGRFVTFAYTGLVPGLPTPTAGDDAAAARWVPITEAYRDDCPLAFDHRRILAKALSIASSQGF